MAIYITQGRYKRDTVTGMISIREHGTVAVKRLIKAAGGNLIACYVKLGEYDFIAVSEFSDETAAESAVCDAAALCDIADVKTTLSARVAQRAHFELLLSLEAADEDLGERLVGAFPEERVVEVRR